MNPRKVLVVDDEQAVRKSVSMAFKREGMEVKSASSGEEALAILQLEQFDLIVLDVMMGEMDGFYVVNVIRKQKIYTPVLFLSGNLEEQSKILAISLGGDDYLTKPFSLAMLTTKVNALLRRSQEYNAQPVQNLYCGELCFDISSYQLYKRERMVQTTSKETALLRFLMENQNQVFTKEQLYEHVWDNHIVDDNTIMVYIKRLRDKIEDDPKNPRYLRTAWGLGYIFGNK